MKLRARGALARCAAAGLAMARIVIAAVVFAGLFCSTVARAHDIPASVVIQALVRPSADAIELIVRVPLKALRDIEYPRLAGGYLDLSQADDALREAVLRWLVEAFVLERHGVRLPAWQPKAWRASLESERPFSNWAAARAHVTGAPLPPETRVPVEQVMLDVLLRVPAGPRDSDPAAAGQGGPVLAGADADPADGLVLTPNLQRFGLRVNTVLRSVRADGSMRVWDLHGEPGPIALNPGALRVGYEFARRGLLHVLEGVDHLLFVACLVLPLRRFRALVGVVTAFTVGHSLTLAAAAVDLLPSPAWFGPFVEWMIAASVVGLAIETVVMQAGPRLRWLSAMLFGLVHGFGFAAGLRETLQFAGDHLVAALFAFNLGIEAGQLLALLVLVPLLAWLLGRVVSERLGVIVLSALIAHTAWHWALERWQVLSQVW